MQALCAIGGIPLKKKIRHITVDDRKYNWRVTSLDEQNVLLRIWVDGFKKSPWIEAKFPFRDPWLNFADLVAEHNRSYDASSDNLFEGITPKKVKCIIEAVIRDKGIAKEIRKPLSLEWSPKLLQATYKGL